MALLSDRRAERTRPTGAWSAGRAVLVVAFALLLGGCISDEREDEIGTTMASEVNPHLPIVEDPLINSYLSSVGRALGQVSGRPEVDYRFYLVNTDVVNAFALPGGHIYLTRGLVEKTQSGAEFAGVLAHEIGHVAARHGVQKMERQLRTGSLVNVLYNTILGGEPEILRDNSLQLANAVWTAGHSRRDEQEADRLAVRYLSRAGVDPNGMVSLLSSLLAEEQQAPEMGRMDMWLSSHPLTSDRLDAAESTIERLDDSEPPVTEVDLTPFSTFRDLVIQNAPQWDP